MANNTYTRSQLATPLYKAVEKVTKPAFKKHGLAESRLITEWHTIAGPLLARRALPVKLTFPKNKREGGTLHLRVASGWAPEVQHLEPVILSKIATYFGYKAVGRLFIQQGPLPESKDKPTKTKAPPPLDESDRLALAELTGSVTDTELKTALQRLGEAIIHRRNKT